MCYLFPIQPEAKLVIIAKQPEAKLAKLVIIAKQHKTKKKNEVNFKLF